MNKAKEYRSRAAEARALAASAKDEAAKGHFLEMARVWEVLASEREVLVGIKEALETLVKRTQPDKAP
jgi:hypothetical protein